MWVNTDTCWFVNGIIEKNDGNFFKNFFVSQIGETSVYQGSYPSKESELKNLE